MTVTQMRRLRSLLRLLWPSLAALSITGACALLPRPVETPIPMTVHGDLSSAEEVFVLLPGIHDSMASFEDRGFLPAGQALLKGRRQAAFIAVDAHFGYYRERSIELRLKDEVLSGLDGKKVTVVGISLGGLGALVTARRYPELFDRIVLVAPFLGWPEDIERIKRDPNGTSEDEMEAEILAIWSWLRDGAGGIPTTLLYGQDDKFTEAYDHLAKKAPSIVLQGRQGGHDWATWNSLWATWLTEDLSTSNVAEADWNSR